MYRPCQIIEHRLTRLVVLAINIGLALSPLSRGHL